MVKYLLFFIVDSFCVLFKTSLHNQYHKYFLLHCLLETWFFLSFTFRYSIHLELTLLSHMSDGDWASFSYNMDIWPSTTSNFEKIPTWFWCMILNIQFWIWFANFFFLICQFFLELLHPCSLVILVYNSSSFSTRMILVSQKKVRKHFFYSPGEFA